MKSRWLRLPLVVTVAFVVHLPALVNGYTWLDHGDVEGGAALVPLSQLPSLFTHPYARTGFYRPLTALTLSLDAASSGVPFGYHLTNLMLHALAAALVLLLAEALELGPLAATGAALLFAVHTTTSLVANQLTYRGEALLMISLSLVLLGQIRGRALLVGVGLLLGCFSKETTFVLGPLLMAGLWRWHRPSRAVLAAAVASLLVAGVVRQSVAPPWRLHVAPLSANAWLGTRLASLGHELSWLAWPWRGVLCDAVPISGVLSWRAALGAVGVAGGLWLAWKVRPFGILALLAATPMLNLVPLPRMASPHYLYVPLAFLGMGLVAWADKVGWRRWAFAALLAPLAVSSVLDSWRYRDDHALFAREVAEGPQCREAHLYLGDWLRGQGALEEAARAYTVAAAPSEGFVSYSDVGAALTNLGVVRTEQERPADAVVALSVAYQLPADPLAHRQRAHNLAAVLLQLGDFSQVEQLLRREAERSDPLPESLKVLANAVGAQGREAEARELIRRSLLLEKAAAAHP